MATKPRTRSTYHLLTPEQRRFRRKLHLKFASDCARCCKPMPVGALAFWHPDPGIVAHIDCGAAHLVGPHGNHKGPRLEAPAPRVRFESPKPVERRPEPALKVPAAVTLGRSDYRNHARPAFVPPR